MIELRRLTKRFGRVTATGDLSFTVRPGRVTAFLGPNGAGKTTTMRIILGWPPRPRALRWLTTAVTSRSSARFGTSARWSTRRP